MSAARHTETQRAILTVATLSAFLGPFLISSINIALPAIEREFSLDAVSLGWIVTSYLLSSAIFLLPIGRLADITGEKNLFLLGMVVFTASTLLCAAAPSGLFLIVMRVFQGLGASMTATTGAPLLISAFPPSERGRLLGMNVAAVYVGLALGPFAGGIITQQAGWRSIFLLSTVLGIAGLIITLSKFKHIQSSRSKGKFDVTGTILYGASLFLIVYHASRLHSGLGFAMTGLGVVMMILFILQCNRSEHPLFDTALFTRNRLFAFSNLAALISYSSTASIVFIMSLFLQKVKDFSPQHAGVILVSQPIVMAVLSPVAGRLSDRTEPRYIASAGMFMNALGLFFLSTLDGSTPQWVLVGALVFMGIGFALFSSPNMNTIMSSVEKRQLGVASGTASTMRITGHMVSMTVVMLVFSARFSGVQVAQVPDELFAGTARMIYLIFGLLSLTGVFFSFSRGDMRN